MFHNSTTLHHSHNLFFPTWRENRLVYAGGPNIVARTMLRTAVIWDYMKPIRWLGRMYSWTFGWPLFLKAGDYAMKGARKVGDGVEWSAYAAKEAALGAAQITMAPPLMLAKSRLTMIKRMLWNVPIATFSAFIRTPIALALSPFRMALGVRDAIKSIPHNASEILKSVYEFRLWDAIKNTRKAITDVILPPMSRPALPVLAPAGHLAGTILNAEPLVTLDTIRQSIEKVIPEGIDRIRNAPATATAWLDEQNAIAAAKREILEKEKQAKKDAMAAQVAEDKGEAPLKGAGGGGGGGGKKG